MTKQKKNPPDPLDEARLGLTIPPMLHAKVQGYNIDEDSRLQLKRMSDVVEHLRALYIGFVEESGNPRVGEVTQKALRELVNEVMSDFKANGDISDYTVVCDASNNPPDVLCCDLTALNVQWKDVGQEKPDEFFTTYIGPHTPRIGRTQPLLNGGHL